MAPLTDNPNAPDNCGETPIYVATINGHTEIVKILASFTDNPNNAGDKYGKTPIHVATSIGHSKIVKFLASFGWFQMLQNNDADAPQTQL